MVSPTQAVRAPHVLIVDDQHAVREALRLLLKSAGMRSTGVDSPAAAMQAVAENTFDCALVDLNYERDTTSGEEGIALLAQLQRHSPDLRLIAITAWGNVALAVRAMRAGACDFIEKPWDNDQLTEAVRHQALDRLGGHRDGWWRLDRQASDGAASAGTGELIAESAAMRRVLTILDRVAPSDANVLILGENGTGKSMLAEYVHERSQRADKPLIKVNMGGISETVFESEMFGHVRGAFTDARAERVGRFELARGGSLFLDEIGNVPASQQPKLLRVLERGEFERLGSSHTQVADVRLISATNGDLSEMVAQGQFRRDLLYRINTMEVTLPPLRERREDIIPMARSFVLASGRRYGRSSLRLSASAEKALSAHLWPGNVRELAHMMERVALLSERDLVTADDLHFGSEATMRENPEDMTLDEVEAWLVRRSVGRHEGNLQRAAEKLGITRQALYRRLEKHGLRTALDHDTDG